MAGLTVRGGPASNCNSATLQGKTTCFLHHAGSRPFILLGCMLLSAYLCACSEMLSRAAMLLQAGRLVHMAASPQLVACSTVSGDIKLYSAASLEEVSSLTWPGSTASAVAPVAVSVSFSPCGTQLSALFANGGLCTWDCSGATEVRGSMLPHHAA